MNRILLIITIALVASCSKDDKPAGHDKTPNLVIDLQQSAISINQIDSADVVFRKVGTDTKVKQRFSKSAQHLLTTLQSLTPGTWNADIEVYTKTVNQLSNQYVIIKPISIDEKLSEVRLSGPGATSGNGWLKRHVKASPNNEVIVIIPDEVYDSYFELRSTSQQQLAVGIQREATHVNYLVEQQNWACANDCFKDGRYADINTFMPFTQAIMAKEWKRNEISLSVLNDKGEELLSYERTWNQ